MSDMKNNCQKQLKIRMLAVPGTVEVGRLCSDHLGPFPHMSAELPTTFETEASVTFLAGDIDDGRQQPFACFSNWFPCQFIMDGNDLAYLHSLLREIMELFRALLSSTKIPIRSRFSRTYSQCTLG